VKKPLSKSSDAQRYRKMAGGAELESRLESVRRAVGGSHSGGRTHHVP
jgi:hypothetical protein